MTRLILIRHGESTWNPLGIYQGQIDTPLSERGRRQMMATAARLREIAIDAKVIYTSPLRRASESASIIARELNIPALQDSRLQEIHHGHWQGLRIDEVRKRWGKLWDAWRMSPTTVQMPGGEHFRDVQRRVMEAVRDITHTWPTSTIIIVAHDLTLKVIIAEIASAGEVSLPTLCLENGGLTIIEWHGNQRRLLVLNETKHLREIGSSLTSQAL